MELYRIYVKRASENPRTFLPDCFKYVLLIYIIAGFNSPNFPPRKHGKQNLHKRFPTIILFLEFPKTIKLTQLLTNHTTFAYSILRYGIPHQYFCSKYTWFNENMSAVAPEITLTEITRLNSNN